MAMFASGAANPSSNSQHGGSSTLFITYYPLSAALTSQTVYKHTIEIL